MSEVDRTVCNRNVCLQRPWKLNRHMPVDHDHDDWHCKLNDVITRSLDNLNSLKKNRRVRLPMLRVYSPSLLISDGSHVCFIV